MSIGDRAADEPGVLRITALPDQTGVAVEGDVDFRSLETFTRAITEAIEASPDDVHVDLSGLDFIEVSGMRVLADAARRLGRQDRRLVLRGIAPHLRPVLRVVGWYDGPGVVLDPGPED